MSSLHRQQEDDSDMELYNIAGKLGGIGRSLLIRAVHEMDDVDDIQQFVCASRCTHEVMMDKLFPWSFARGLSKVYSLVYVAAELTDIV